MLTAKFNSSLSLSLAFAASTKTTLSEPSLRKLLKKIWKFFTTPKTAIPAGPEKIAINLLIMSPDVNIRT